MLSKQKFIHHSLHLNLFFLRILKEHFIFLEASLFIKNKNLMKQADLFKNEFERLLKQTIMLSDGMMESMPTKSNEFVTPFTLQAEKVTQFATGIPIDMQLTVMEASLFDAKSTKQHHEPIEEQIYRLNERIIKMVNMIIKVKTELLKEVLSCKLFVNTYPTLLEHVTEEAMHYLDQLQKLQSGIDIHTKEDMVSHENFWNHIMEEHSEFIRGLLDPKEEDLFDMANTFVNEFERLVKETSDARKLSRDLTALTERTIKSVTALRDFKIQATEGLLSCKIRAIILPLLADHVLREANHYLNSLEMAEDM